MLYIEIIRQAVSVSDIFLLVGKPEIEKARPGPRERLSEN